MKKLMGRTEMEDALKKLDKLTQEEALMAAAQNLKITHGVDERVKGVADTVVAIERRSSPSLISADYKSSPVLSENQLRESVHKWLSPPDPSTNYNIACGTHHKKEASWFFQGSIFQDWKSTGSLLWIHGKRLLCPLSNPTPVDNISYSSWLGQKCYLVRDFQ